MGTLENQSNTSVGRWVVHDTVEMTWPPKGSSSNAIKYTSEVYKSMALQASNVSPAIAVITKEAPKSLLQRGDWRHPGEAKSVEVSCHFVIDGMISYGSKDERRSCVKSVIPEVKSMIPEVNCHDIRRDDIRLPDTGRRADYRDLGPGDLCVDFMRASASDAFRLIHPYRKGQVFDVVVVITTNDGRLWRACERNACQTDGIRAGTRTEISCVQDSNMTKV